MKVCIITHSLPPELDGIGDYTAQLASHLARSVEVVVLAGMPADPLPVPGVRTERVFDRARPITTWRIRSAVRRHRPDWVLLQYNAFSYGRWGLNLHLPLCMSSLRNLGASTAVMMHEPFVPRKSAKLALLSTWQKWQFSRLGRDASAVFVSIQPWIGRFESWFPGKPLVHLPVASPLPCCGSGPAAARQTLGIPAEALVLGCFGTAHASRLFEHFREAVRAASRVRQDVRFLYIGPNGPTVAAELAPTQVIAAGALPPAEVSSLLPAMDIYLAPFSDGVSTRRTSVMAALQHGLAVVGTRGHLTDTMLSAVDGQAMVLADVAEPQQFGECVAALAQNADARSEIGIEARKFYEANFGWERMACTLLATLESCSDLRAVQAVPLPSERIGR